MLLPCRAVWVAQVLDQAHFIALQQLQLAALAQRDVAGPCAIDVVAVYQPARGHDRKCLKATLAQHGACVILS